MATAKKAPAKKSPAKKAVAKKASAKKAAPTKKKLKAWGMCYEGAGELAPITKTTKPKKG